MHFGIFSVTYELWIINYRNKQLRAMHTMPMMSQNQLHSDSLFKPNSAPAEFENFVIKH
jgi:hypothetical protein